jgi:DNA (cytosine-5)-methyltransferase 1
MGYPSGFKIPVSDTQAYRQFGNSVVVPVVERIAEQVLKALSQPSIEKPRVALSLFARSNATTRQRRSSRRKPRDQAGALTP